MEAVGVQNRSEQVAGGPDALVMFRDAITTRISLDGTAMSDSETVAYESTIEIVEEYLHDVSDFTLTLPTTTFDDRLTLTHGNRTIEVRHFGPGVTRGDAIVFLPQDGVLVAGDLVDNPVSFSYGADVAGWMSALKSIVALEARVVVPGHGNVLWDSQQVRALYNLLASIEGQTMAAAADGQTLEKVREQIDVREFRNSLVGDNKMLAYLFDRYFLPGAISSTFNAVATDR
jgi:glyoxylase-like metal-dependent hydrolase (beta-lactamase superfamily II)